MALFLSSPLLLVSLYPSFLFCHQWWGWSLVPKSRMCCSRPSLYVRCSVARCWQFKATDLVRCKIRQMYFLMFPLPGRNISVCLCAIREQKEVLGYQPHFDKQSALIKQYGKGSRAVNSSLLTFSLLYKREKNEDSLAMWPTLSREGGTFITRTIKWHQEQTAKRSSK